MCITAPTMQQFIDPISIAHVWPKSGIHMGLSWAPWDFASWGIWIADMWLSNRIIWVKHVIHNHHLSRWRNNLHMVHTISPYLTNITKLYTRVESQNDHNHGNGFSIMATCFLSFQAKTENSKKAGVDMCHGKSMGNHVSWSVLNLATNWSPLLVNAEDNLTRMLFETVCQCPLS